MPYGSYWNIAGIHSHEKRWVWSGQEGVRQCHAIWIVATRRKEPKITGRNQQLRIKSAPLRAGALIVQALLVAKLGCLQILLSSNLSISVKTVKLKTSKRSLYKKCNQWVFPNHILLVSFQDAVSDTKRDPGGKRHRKRQHWASIYG